MNLIPRFVVHRLQRKVQRNRLGVKQFVPKELSRDDCTKLYQIISNISKAVKIAENIIPLDHKLRKEHLKVLSYSPVITSQDSKKGKKWVITTESCDSVE